MAAWPLTKQRNKAERLTHTCEHTFFREHSDVDEQNEASLCFYSGWYIQFFFGTECKRKKESERNFIYQKMQRDGN